MQAACLSFDLYDFMEDQVSTLSSATTKPVDAFFYVDNTDPSILSESSLPLGVYSDSTMTLGNYIFTEGEIVSAQAKSVNISVEGWQLALAALAILGGSYYFAWDSHKSLLTELGGMRTDMRADRTSFDDDLKKLIAELKAEREADRQQANVNSEAVTAQLMKIYEAQGSTAEAIKTLQKK
ncbi:hypothetical protein [Pseudomonas lactucae]|uniref:Uncharacterized protein n=1 Tax=Pseudomonas lactucae TaxID=2813360 RepID=A0A9X0Y6I7_9PSED|nr:hypothetical protein [Pseudomonas lactucae]MBN2974688.1 hypothetical protein [Pseudomonas lactucae]MBN2987327.1 hypothetical protein [Pseudomonas lactucae]